MKGSGRLGVLGAAAGGISVPTRLALFAGGLFFLILIAAAGGTAVSVSQASCRPEQSTEVVGNVEGVPKQYIEHYQGAAAKYKLGEQGPAILAAIHKVETDFGTIDLPGVTSGENSAGAGGPMQFLQPTWDAYGVDGDGDGDKDRYDPVDAIYGAANYLRASGAPGNWHDAIYAYNHAEWYVDDVLAFAEKFGEATSTEIATSTTSEFTGPSQTITGLKDFYAEFAEIVTSETGLSLRVTGAWTLAEGGPDDNPLNIGPGKSYGSIEAGAKATVNLLNTSLYGGIMASVDGSDMEQLEAIDASPWCGGSAGCPGYLELLKRTYGRVSVEGATPEPVESCEATAVASEGEQIGELGVGNPDPIALARNPRMILTPYAKQDLLAYNVSPKLIAVLDAGTKHHKIGISVFSTGHGLGSNHIPGRGADISSVDGEVCNGPASGRSGSCWEFAQELGAIDDECYRSTELIYYFDPSPAPDHWAAGDHDDHIHLAWNGPGTSSIFNYKGVDPCSPEAISGG